MFEIEKRFSPARVLWRVVVVEWKTVKCVLLIAAASKWFPSEAKLNDTKRTNLALSPNLCRTFHLSVLSMQKKIEANYCNPLKIQSIRAQRSTRFNGSKNLTTKCNYRQFAMHPASI